MDSRCEIYIYEHYEMNSVLTLEEMVCGPLKRTARAYDYEFLTVIYSFHKWKKTQWIDK